MDSGVKKVLVVVVLLVLVLPFLPRLLPKPMTWERIEQGFTAAGLQVQQFETVTPSMDAVEQAAATINGVNVQIYRYDNEGPIAKNLEYQKQDPGAAMVEAWGLAQSLGAAQPQQTPSRAGRRGLYMIVATGDDVPALERIIDAFKNL